MSRIGPALRENHPPSSTMTLGEFREQFPSGGREWKLVCTECGHSHSGTVAAEKRPPWILVEWICTNCGPTGQAFRARECRRCGERYDEHSRQHRNGSEPLVTCPDGQRAIFEDREEKRESASSTPLAEELRERVDEGADLAPFFSDAEREAMYRESGETEAERHERRMKEEGITEEDLHEARQAIRENEIYK